MLQHVDRELLDLAGGDGYAPSWSPDGARIAFTRIMNGTSELYVAQAVGGSGLGTLVSSSGEDVFPFRASWRDGATRIQALFRIVLPIAIPGLVCAVLFAFTLSWNEFIYALTFTSSSEEITASVGITTELIRGDIYFWGGLMAGAVLGSVPIVVLYVFFLDYYVSGLTAGAVK